MNSAEAPTSGSSSLLARVLAMSMALVVLFLLQRGFVYSPCWGIFFLVALAAWPIWYHQQEYILFQRRAILERATNKEGSIRKWMWAGSITRLLQVFVALVWAGLLLSFSVLLAPEHWWMLAADTLLLALIVGPVRQRLASQVRGDQVGILSRRWPLLLFNLLFLTVCFLLIDFFVLSVPDTRGLTWNAVVEMALNDYSKGIQCPISGAIIGFLAAIDRLTWHLSQVVIPTLPGQELKLAAWGLFLLQAGIVVYVFTRLQLGVVALLDTRKLRLSAVTGESTLSKAFIVTILILAIPYLYAAFKLRYFDPELLQDQSQQLLELADPCKPDREEIGTLEKGLDEDLEFVRQKVKSDAANQVDAQVDEIFSDIEKAVDQYLDWYFTLTGEYVRLTALATGDLAQLMADELEHQLFESIDFSKRVEETNQRIAQGSIVRMLGYNKYLGQELTTKIQANLCSLGKLDVSTLSDHSRTGIRVTAAAGSGALVVATSSKLLAKKTATVIIAKIGAKKSFAAALGILGKVSAKKGGSIILTGAGAAVLCSPSGPLAVLCGIAAGIATWLIVDKAALEIDEALFRDEMKADMLSVLRDQKLEVAAELKKQHFGHIDGMAVEIQRKTKGVFQPFKDGL